MKIFGYRITRLGWLFLISLLISLINPVSFAVCAGVWMFIGIVNFGNTINKENR
ncbi:hypothetical protein CLU96_1921 [Chryseobacterium sp. 52]|uniref:hypothetical protein n=1 Tax=Chryseobacterium sp. 52 TaxID=2035213 RepID=UPI000C64256B|nr:hypothetical protein [Chryseobacterium sp. 52]PIF44922.1 hypothetical protein CLU96_1921 [Chryseobacterium sp. 52]